MTEEKLTATNKLLKGNFLSMIHAIKKITQGDVTLH